MIKFLFIFASVPFFLFSCTSDDQVKTISVFQSGGVEITSGLDSSTQKNAPLYVDVREDDEWQAGHVSGAIHVKLGDIESGKFDEIPRNREVLLYCRSGRRSGIATEILEKAGYTVKNVGGMIELKGVEIVVGK